MSQDHDILITVANDIKHMVQWTKDHTAEDNKKHAENLLKFDKIDADVEALKEFKWKSTAIVGAVLIVSQIAIQMFFK